MSRIPALDPATTQGKTKELLAGVEKMLGATPNLFRTAASSTAALDALVGMFGATGRDTLGAKLRAEIALVVAETNGCDYCLSAHTFLGGKAGLTAQEMDNARYANDVDGKRAAILQFARLLVLERGRVGERALKTVRAAGVSDAEVLEVISNVVLNIFTNYVNLVADTEIDFPVVKSGR